MNSELIMKSDVLDLLFDNRNKAYGAYTLRKFYNHRLIKSLAVMLTSVIAFSAFTFLPESRPKGDFFIADAGFRNIAPDVKAPKIKPAIKKIVTITPVSSLKLLSKIVIVNKKDSTEILQDLNNRAIGSVTTIVINDPGIQLVPADQGNGVAAGPVKNTEVPIDIAKPISNPDVMPEYPGGMEALRRFLTKNLTNPRDLEDGEMIGVKVTFVVGYDGKLKSFQLLQDGGTEFNNEVMRVLKKMPAWVPGKSRGQNVSVYYTIPVKFIPQG